MQVFFLHVSGINLIPDLDLDLIVGDIRTSNNHIHVMYTNG